MLFQFLPILPIIATILVFLLVRRTVVALFAGCMTAALIITNFMPLQSLLLFGMKFLQVNQIDHMVSVSKLMSSSRLLLYIFILFLNVFISLIHQSGMAYGYYNFLSSRLKSKVGAELSTLVLGLFLFVDDYLNIITSTKVSGMFCHRFKIPKLKICFLAACLAGPLCSIIPISSWGADIIATIASSTANTSIAGLDAFLILLCSLPFVFFSILIVSAAFIIVLRRYSFGIILREESLLQDEQGSAHEDVPTKFLHFNLWHFIFPIFSMVGSIILAMLYFGNYFSGSLGIFGALKSNPFPEKSLLLGTVGSLLVVLAIFLQMRLISFANVINSFREGFSESTAILLLLSFSATFAAFIKALGAGELLCAVAEPFISAAMLPASIFIITGALAFLLGSSWATINIVIPSTLPVVQGILTLAGAPTVDLQYLMFVSIGAVISGAVFGSGLSPIADLLNMATKNCQIPHTSYLTAQFQYSMLVGLAALASFVASGFLVGQSYLFCWSISIAIGFTVMIFLLKVMTVLDHYRKS